MKKIFNGLLMMTIVFTSCKKNKDISKVVTIPTITVNGSPGVTINPGDTYNDMGASFTDEDGSVTTIAPSETTLDASKPGMYTVTYSRHTSSGYNASATRFVLVSSISDAIDFSGNYERFNPVTGGTMTVTKVSRGLYKTDNAGAVPGNAAFIYDVYFGHVSDSTIVVPLQPTPHGDLYCDQTYLHLSASPVSFGWVVRRSPNYGTALRNFRKI